MHEQMGSCSRVWMLQWGDLLTFTILPQSLQNLCQKIVPYALLRLVSQPLLWWCTS